MAKFRKGVCNEFCQTMKLSRGRGADCRKAALKAVARGATPREAVASCGGGAGMRGLDGAAANLAVGTRVHVTPGHSVGWKKPFYGKILNVVTTGGMSLVNRAYPNDSAPGEPAYLVGRGDDPGRSGALWFGAEALRAVRQRR